MKEIIEYTIKNGFDINSLDRRLQNEYYLKKWHLTNSNKYLILTYYHRGAGSLDQMFLDSSIYHLIFGTNFIEYLVGSGLYCQTKIEYHKENKSNFNTPCDTCDPYSSAYDKSCFLSGWKIPKANFHREEMSSMIYVDDIIKYIKELHAHYRTINI